MSLEYLRPHRRPYLASPFRKYTLGPQKAYEHVCELTGKLWLAGIRAYSPIAACYGPATQAGIDPADNEFWTDLNLAELDLSDCLVIALMDGWLESEGVSVELGHAGAKAMPIYGIRPATLEVIPFEAS